jgi:hypothetical protein
MSGFPFDTLQLAERLEARRFTAVQSRTFASALAEAAATADVATKADPVSRATKAVINELRIATKTDISELKADLLKWIVSAIGLQTVVTTGAVITLMRLSH